MGSTPNPRFARTSIRRALLWNSVLFFFAMASLIGCRRDHPSDPDDDGLGDVHEASFLDGGRTRGYLYYVPANLSVGAPLVLMLHGGGGDAENVMNDTCEGRWNELAERDGFVVAYPNGLGGFWNDCRNDLDSGRSEADDASFLIVVIDRLVAELGVDIRRVYVAGHSNGAMMALRMALERPDRIAAVCACAGYLAASTECAGLGGAPAVFVIAGTEDPAMPFEGGAVTPVGGGNHGTVLSAPATVEFWVQRFGCGSPQTRQLLDTSTSDRSTVTAIDYDGCTGGNVRFYRIEGGGHGWPATTQHSPAMQLLLGRKNQDIRACDEAWEFFRGREVSARP